MTTDSAAEQRDNDQPSSVQGPFPVPVHPIDERLQALPPSASPGKRLEVIWSFYEASTGTRLMRPPSASEREAVRDFLREERKRTHGPSFFTARRQRRIDAAHNLTEKAWSIVQSWCSVCELAVEDDGAFPMKVVFPIQVMPWSAQSQPDKVALRNEVAAELRERGFFKPPTTLPVCLTIVAVLPRAARIKDTDNLVKGLLDSMQGLVYVDDNQIQCLTSRRIEYAGSVGYYLVSASAVLPWDCDVVFDDPAAPIILAGREVRPTT